MNLTIKNLRGIESATIDLSSPVTLVAGLNGAGKTSVMLAAAACLTRSPAPVAGMKLNQAAVLLRDGTKRGSASLDGATVNWPGGTVTADDDAPDASRVAAGIENPATMTQAQRAAYLIDTLSAVPTLDDLAAALDGIPSATVDAVWRMIESEGWDAAHKRAKESGAKAKGAWEQITGENYGAAKARDWRPSAARGVDPDEAERAAVDAAAALEAAIAGRGADQAEVQRLTALMVAAGPAELALQTLERDEFEARAQWEAATQRCNAASDALREIEDEIEAMPKPGQAEAFVPCPECGTHLVAVSRSELRRAVPADEAENQRRQAALDAAYRRANDAADVAMKLRTDVDQAQAKLNDLQRRLLTASSAVTAGRNAEIALQAMPTTGTTDAEIQRLRDTLEAAQLVLIDLDKAARAAEKQELIEQNQRIVAALDTTGVRQTVLAAKLGDFNARLERITSSAGWMPVVVDADMNIGVGGMPYEIRSTAEQFRARVALQIALAQIDGSPLLVIDAADVLDRPGRNGLMAALVASGKHALVAMTYNAVSDVPRGAQWLKSYWVEGGTVEGAA